MPTRDWQIHVWKSTATSLSTSLVDFTITNAQLSQVPVITGSRLRPLDGRTEARPWTISVNDGSSFITSQIGDAGGRLDLLNRFVQARLSIDGSTYKPVGGGRLIDAVNTDNIAEWLLSVQDEWLAGANTMLFTTNTTLLYPPRPLNGYKGVGAGRQAQATVNRINSASTLAKRYWLVRMSPAFAGCPPLTDEAVGFIRGDMTSLLGSITTNGNFRHLRFRSAGVDYKVVGFDTIKSVPYRPDRNNVLFDVDELDSHQRNGGSLNFWIAASSTAFGGTGSATLGLNEFPALHAMTAPASPATPLHIWSWSSANPWGTIHPMQVLKDCLDGVYSSSSEARPYYSTESFSGTANIRKLPSVGVAFRVTSPAPMRQWVTENLLVPHGMAAFGDYRGKVAFKSVVLPDPQLGYSTANLYQFTSTNLRQPHPDWRTTRREQVTQVALEYERVAQQVSPGAVIPNIDIGTFTPPGFSLGGDGLAVRFDTTVFNHDRISRYGTYPLKVNFHGYGAVGDFTNVLSGFPEWTGAIHYYRGEFVQRLFHRYGDGPISGTLYALPGVSTVEPGDFVRLTLGSYPNISNSQRGGTRLVQIMSKDVTPEGYAYEYLDAASAAAPLTSPTVTLSTSTADPRNTLRATVSGIPSGGVVSLYMAESNTTSPPGSTSANWHPVYTTGTYGMVSATGTYNLPRLKSNQRFFVKGQAAAANRPRSAYTTPVTRVTGAITAPNTFAMSSVKAQTAGASWVVGDVNYPVDFHVDTVTTGTPTTSNLLFRLPPGSNRTFLSGLTQGTAYKSWVRHSDPYGGFSNSDSTTFTMTSTATTSNVRKAPPLGGLYVVFGST